MFATIVRVSHHGFSQILTAIQCESNKVILNKINLLAVCVTYTCSINQTIFNIPLPLDKILPNG